MVVSLHGSGPLLAVVRELEKGSKACFDSIPNITFYESNNSMRFTERIDECVDYETDFTHWDYIDKLPLIIPVHKSIGCPYRCKFCEFCTMSPKLYLRSKSSLLKELQSLKKQSGKEDRSLIRCF